ncbi:unnamed protein product, partial [Acanthoscelides obtectus]
MLQSMWETQCRVESQVWSVCP